MPGEITGDEAAGLRFRINADVGAAAQARSFMERLELPPTVLEDVQLLISELVTNSYRHSGTPPDDEVEIRVLSRPERVRIEVEDAGPGFKPPSRPVPGTTSGWGLYLVNAISTRWGVASRSPTVVWFEVTL